MSLVSVKNQLTHFTRRQEKKGTKASKDKIVVASIQKAMSTSCSTFRTDRGKERERRWREGRGRARQVEVSKQVGLYQRSPRGHHSWGTITALLHQSQIPRQVGGNTIIGNILWISTRLKPNKDIHYCIYTSPIGKSKIQYLYSMPSTSVTFWRQLVLL